MTAHPSQGEAAAVMVGGFVGIGKLVEAVQPLLADLSYIAAIAVAIVTIYYKIKGPPK